MVDRLRANNIGPVREADIRFGDVTIFVGPQATGKSIFLQLLKLLLDKPSIHNTMQHYGLSRQGDADDTAEGGWGGLTEFSGEVGDIVAEVANRNDDS